MIIRLERLPKVPSTVHLPVGDVWVKGIGALDPNTGRRTAFTDDSQIPYFDVVVSKEGDNASK